MAQNHQDLLYMDEETNSVFEGYLPSDTESEHDRSEIKSAYRLRNKGKQRLHHSECHNKTFLEDSSEVFTDIPQSNNNSFIIAGSSPSTSSTPRFRSRNSSVRSIQTVDCCVPHLERDGFMFRAELRSHDQEEEYSSDDDDEDEDEEFVPHNHFDKHEEYINGIDEEIVDEGLRLYLQFLQDEIAQSRLRPPDCISSPNENFPRNISSLRILADQFSVSPQRQWVRIQAESVPLDTLDFVSFTELLTGLFQEGGVTWERVVVLFFFCADLSIRALKESLMRTFHRITEWTTTFICDNFSRWVAANGGWTEILHTSISEATRLAFLGFFCVGIIAVCAFIRNNGAK